MIARTPGATTAQGPTAAPAPAAAPAPTPLESRALEVLASPFPLGRL